MKRLGCSSFCVFQVSDAQELVRRRIVATYLDDVISEQSLNEDPQGLKGLLQRVNRFIPTKLDLLVRVVCGFVSLFSGALSSCGALAYGLSFTPAGCQGYLLL